MTDPCSTKIPLPLATCLFENAPIPMAIVSNQGVLLHVNTAYCTFLGYSAAEMTGKSIRDITHPDDWNTSWTAIQKLKADKSPIVQLEKRYLHKNGQELWAELNVCLVCDETGTPAYSIAQLVDITDRKHIQESLKESQQWLSRFLELAPLPIIIVGLDGTIEYMNRKVTETLGYTHEDIPTLADWWRLAYPDDAYRAEVIADVTTQGTTKLVETPAAKGKSYRVTCKDGTVKMVSSYRGTVIDKTLVMFNDITERVLLQKSLEASQTELEQKVKDRTAKLRDLTGEMIRVEHQERQRIAHVLHEDLQQWLAAIKFRVGEMQAESAIIPGPMDQVLDMIDKAIGVTRTLSADLCPPILFELGLKATLEWVRADMDQKFGLKVKTTMDSPPPPLSEKLSLFVFDTIRELLMNVTKHAGVKAASIEVSCPGQDQIEIDVQDDGNGFDPSLPMERKFGLFSIRERTEALGGRFVVRSHPGQGTHISLILPVQGKILPDHDQLRPLPECWGIPRPG